MRNFLLPKFEIRGDDVMVIDADLLLPALGQLHLSTNLLNFFTALLFIHLTSQM